MIPLHVHSNYSLLQGAASLDSLINRAKEFNLSSLALTDTNAMYGLIPFAKKAIESGIKPIVGAYLDDPNESDVNCLVIAKNNAGYSELCKIITLRHLNDHFSLVKILNDTFTNLLVISKSIKFLRLSTRDNVFVELTALKSQKKVNRNLYELAQTLKRNLILTNPIYFLDKEDYLTHKILTAIKLNKNLENLAAEDVADPECYFKNPNEIDKTWEKIPEVFNNVNHIVSTCNVDLQLGEYKFPISQIPNHETSSSFLRKIAYKGLETRYKTITELETTRMEKELSVIEELNYTDYFIVVWDIVNEAKRRGMMIIGRGSAANSLVSYCLGLTNVDPLKYNLYFERFLNKGRSSPPDVDIDFSWKERDEIVKYVFEKYGYENVAMISTHVTFRARSAFREVAKAFGISNEEISKYSKFIPWTSAENLPNITQIFPEAKNLKLNVEPWKSIVQIAAKIANYPRHLSIHPGGIVIAPKPITNYTALEYAKNKGLGLIITQPDMHGVEDLGLVKIDLLSQRSLGVLRDTMNKLNNEVEEDDI
ncbi:MAG: DNA polymerase III subunit alpha [Ignavibacteriaceae bacterium]|nr:DNA polymerase III subunit alpha [Ignavibacteriaceae bacterium]